MIKYWRIGNISIFVSVLALSLVPLSCKNADDVSNEDYAARVYQKYLLKSEVQNVVPKELSGVDSAVIAERFIQEWVDQELILQKAILNIGDQHEIEKLVEEYRQSLLVSNYLELLVAQKADVEVSEKEIADYYNANKEQFKLNEAIVLGLILKIPLEAPKLKELNQWMQGRSENDIVELEDYCFQNAQKFEDFRDRWVAVSIINKSLPEAVESRKFKKGVTIQQMDSLSRYYVVVFDKHEENEIAPLLYVRGRIVSVLSHQKRLDYIAELKKDMLNSAIRNKNVEYYENN